MSLHIPVSANEFGFVKEMRMLMLKKQTLNHISQLGSHAFETIGGEIVKVTFIIITNDIPKDKQLVTGLDVSMVKMISEKDHLLRKGIIEYVNQKRMVENPDSRITFVQRKSESLLSDYAICSSGMLTGDRARFYRYFWELANLEDNWEFSQTTVNETKPYGGRSQVIFYQKARGELYKLAQSLKHLNHAVQNWQRGQEVWGKQGVVVSQMGELQCTLYTGQAFDNNIAVILPNNPDYLPAIWAYCQSPEFNIAVRQIDQSLKVTNATLVKIPFDFEHWHKVAEAFGSLPMPCSKDPTQWLFNGHPVDSTQPLQVAVARLLGYCWPQQKSYDLDTTHVVKDDIVCLPPIAGKERAVEQLRRLLATAYGAAWSPVQQDSLLTEVGFGGKSLDLWLRDGFFTQHCSLFHNRPFIWHIWDGLKDGFSALVNLTLLALIV